MTRPLHSSTRGLRPPEQLERPAGFPSSDKTRPDSPVPTLHGAEASQAPLTSPTLPQPAPSRARTLEAGKRWVIKPMTLGAV